MRQMFLALWLSASLYAVCVQPLQAQTVGGSNPDYDKQFYLFVSPNVVRPPDRKAFTLAVGGGVEHLIGQHASLGFELAESRVSSKFDKALTRQSEAGEGNVGWVAFIGGYHFRRRNSAQQLRPFLTAGCGVSGINGAGVGTQFNYGAGFNRWHTRHLGVRVEVRRFVLYSEAEGRFTGARLGLVIR